MLINLSVNASLASNYHHAIVCSPFNLLWTIWVIWTHGTFS